MTPFVKLFVFPGLCSFCNGLRVIDIAKACTAHCRMKNITIKRKEKYCKMEELLLLIQTLSRWWTSVKKKIGTFLASQKKFSARISGFAQLKSKACRNGTIKSRVNFKLLRSELPERQPAQRHIPAFQGPRAIFAYDVVGKTKCPLSRPCRIRLFDDNTSRALNPSKSNTGTNLATIRFTPQTTAPHLFTYVGKLTSNWCGILFQL